MSNCYWSQREFNTNSMSERIQCSGLMAMSLELEANVAPVVKKCFNRIMREMTSFQSDLSSRKSIEPMLRL